MRDELVWTVVFVLALIGALVLWSGHTRSSFEQECKKLNGTTIWDGRQYQCLK